MDSTTLNEHTLTGFNKTRNCTLEHVIGTCEVKTYLDYSVMILIGINAIGIGGHIDGDRMVVLLTKPFIVSVAMFLRFAVIPAIGLGLSQLFKLSPEVAMGTLAVLVAPHEGVSSLFILLLDGDLTASMAISGVNNFSTSAFLPLWAMIYEYQVYNTAGVINLPIREIFIVFGYISTAACIGLLIRTKCAKVYDKYWEYLPMFTVISISYVIVIEIFLHSMVFHLFTLKIIAMSVIVTTCGFLIGAVTGYILRQSQQVTIVLSLEMGVRTTYFTSVLTATSYYEETEDKSNTVPFLSSILSLIPVFVLVLSIRCLRTKSLFEKYFQKNEELDPMCSTSEEMCNNKEYNLA